jgi:hypothetical protein
MSTLCLATCDYGTGHCQPEALSARLLQQLQRAICQC